MLKLTQAEVEHLKYQIDTADEFIIAATNKRKALYNRLVRECAHSRVDKQSALSLDIVICLDCEQFIYERATLDKPRIPHYR